MNKKDVYFQGKVYIDFPDGLSLPINPLDAKLFLSSYARYDCPNSNFKDGEDVTGKYQIGCSNSLPCPCIEPNECKHPYANPIPSAHFKMQNESYPDSQYQRLFNAIHDTGGICLNEEMQTIIRIVHEDFPAPSEGWIKVEDELPELIKGHDYSENVWVICDGILAIMCVFFIREDDGYLGWANCYGKFNGDGEYDDQYNVTHWKKINPPQPPNTN